MSGRGEVDRVVALDGLVNVRDLGGLRRSDGSNTPRGVFLRSENVDGLTRCGWEALASAGVRTVVDLRQQWERDRDVSPRPDWVTTVAVDLDGSDNHGFWTEYRDNGLVNTARYYTPHLRAMPERSVAALRAVATASPGGVLFHCASGRDRTGLVAMLLLAAADVTDDEIVADYLQTVVDDEESRDQLCRVYGTTTEGAFRSALRKLDLGAVMDSGGMTPSEREALLTWRGALHRRERVISRPRPVREPSAVQPRDSS